MIRDIYDLCRHLGVYVSDLVLTREGQDASLLDAIKARLQRRVYKDTECGAWIELRLDAPTRIKQQRWQARIARSVAGLTLAVRRGDRGDWIRDLSTVPQEVRSFFEARRTGQGYWSHWVCGADGPPMSLEDIARIGREMGARVALHPGAGLLHYSTLIEVQVPSRRVTPPLGVWGCVLGSIVEGSDAEVTGRGMLFPFSGAALDREIQSIEGEADRLWREANEDDEDEEG